MKTQTNSLREFIRSEIVQLFEEKKNDESIFSADNVKKSLEKITAASSQKQTTTPAGKDIKGGAAADRAAQLFKSNKQLMNLTTKIKDKNSLASFVQDVIGTVISPNEKGEQNLNATSALASVKKVLDPLSKAAADQASGKKDEK
jgi:hypothetical protein